MREPPTFPAMKQNPAENPATPIIKVTLPAKRPYLPNAFGWLFVAFIVLTFASIALPVFNSVAVRGPETKALAQAKQIGLALKIFAGDNDGKYPGQGVPVQMTKAPTNSNAAFACLFPTYTTSERIFGNSFSAYQTHPPDDVIDPSYTGTPVKTLEPGENVYAYVAGLTDASNPSAPIVVDGTDGTPLYYNSTRSVRGGVWEGKKAVVIRLDNSGSIETLTGRENTRYIPANLPGRPHNLLDVSWLGKDARLLNPAVAP